MSRWQRIGYYDEITISLFSCSSFIVMFIATRPFLLTIPISVITVAIIYSTHCNNFIADPREFAKSGGCSGLACRKTIVVTVTVISNGVEIAITTGTYVGYTVYVCIVRMYRHSTQRERTFPLRRKGLGETLPSLYVFVFLSRSCWSYCAYMLESVSI